MGEQTVKSGKPWIPVSDAVGLKLGTVSGTGVSVSETWRPVHTSNFPISNLVVTITDTGGANGGQGGATIYTFPEGAILILAAICNLTTVAATGIVATAALVGSIGTVAAGVGDSTLTGTEANIIASIAGTLSSSAGTLKGFSGAPAAPFDGTTTPVIARINLAVPDAGITANSTVTLNGSVTLVWILAGDY